VGLANLLHDRDQALRISVRPRNIHLYGAFDRLRWPGISQRGAPPLRYRQPALCSGSTQEPTLNWVAAVWTRSHRVHDLTAGASTRWTMVPSFNPLKIDGLKVGADNPLRGSHHHTLTRFDEHHGHGPQCAPDTWR
jgi:hypothetical protein